MRSTKASFALAVLLMSVMLSGVMSGSAYGQLQMKTENFDVDPNWDGHNNRSQAIPPVQITQSFGYSAGTNRAGGPPGEIGGLITPAGEPASYAKVLPDFSFDDPFSVSGKLNVQVGGGHTMIGFFNSDTLNE